MLLVWEVVLGCEGARLGGFGCDVVLLLLGCEGVIAAGRLVELASAGFGRARFRGLILRHTSLICSYKDQRILRGQKGKLFWLRSLVLTCVD